MYKNKNKCHGCQRELVSGDKVSVIVPNVEIEEGKNDAIHLKLSRNGIEERAMKIYCQECLKIERYIPDEE